MERESLTAKQSRRCCFTLHNPSSEDIENIQQWECDYLIFGLEKCPTTGRPHLQGYVEFKGPKKLQTLKNLHDKIHWENAKYSEEINTRYCSKDGNVWKKGSPKKQGEKKGLKDLIDDIKRGVSLSELDECQQRIYIQYHNGIDKIIHSGKQTRSGRASVYHDIRDLEGLSKFFIDEKISAFWWYKETGWEGYNYEQAVVFMDKPEPKLVSRCSSNIPYKVKVNYGVRNFTSKMLYLLHEYQE